LRLVKRGGEKGVGCWSGDLKSEGKGGDSNQVFKRFRKAKKEERKREMNRLATREREREAQKKGNFSPLISSCW
jgi:hypothetical protein